MKLAALLAEGTCVKVNAVVDPLPLNSSMCGDASADTIDTVERPRNTIKILEPLLGAIHTQLTLQYQLYLFQFLKNLLVFL